MTEIPTWWLAVSAIFFVLQSIFVICLMVAVVALLRVVKELTPKIVAVTDKVQEIGNKVDDLTTTVKSTVESLSTRARHVAGSADLIASSATKTFERFSPVLVAILGALRVLKSIQDLRAARHSPTNQKQDRKEPVHVDRKVKKQDNKELHRGVEQSGSSSGS